MNISKIEKLLKLNQNKEELLLSSLNGLTKVKSSLLIIKLNIDLILIWFLEDSLSLSKEDIKLVLWAELVVVNPLS